MPLPPAIRGGGPVRLDEGPPGEPATELLCGGYAFEGGVCDSLLAAIPELLPLRGAGLRDASMRDALGLLARDVLEPRPGSQAVLDRLLDLLLVYSLRMWFTAQDASPPRWYTAFEDPQVGTALTLMHEGPGRPWTVASLAGEVGLSRAAFARRFAAAVGEAPLAYLTSWRMTIAGDALLAPGATIASVAPTVGYGSEFAFAAAFKRHHGVAPGRWRAARLAAGGDPVGDAAPAVR
jgi:AraC-like DNA-binding protein